MHRARPLLTVLAAAVLVCAAAESAHAQATKGFAVDRFDPAERGSQWFAEESVDWDGHTRPSAGVTLELGVKPLDLYDADDSVRTSIVKEQLYAHVGASLTLKNDWLIGFNFPIALVNNGDPGADAGETFAAPTGDAIGDIRVGVAYRLAGRAHGAARLALGVQLFLPTGTQPSYTGDGTVRAEPRLLFGGDSGAWTYALHAGILLRGSRDFDGIPIGHELQFGGALGVHLGEDVMIGPELYLGTVITESDAIFKGRSTPGEGLLGLHIQASDEWRVNIGLGAGLTRAPGDPQLRALASLEWTAENEHHHPRGDRDHDGIYDDEDACPDVAGVRDNDRRKNGCPPPRLNDGDGDGIADEQDACPTEPGKPSPDPTKNGCPVAQIDVAGKQIVIREVKFAYNAADILPESDEILEGVQKILEEHPEIAHVRVEGHTDNTGSAPYNKKLSERRAQSVMKWLVDHGIDAHRLHAHGYGAERPIDDNSTDAGRQNNRRVELHIEEK